MISEITLKTFKSYKDAILPLSPLTVLIGANASGKSNVIEAMRLLSWLAGGQKLSAIRHAVDDSDKLLRGNVKDLGYLGSQEFSLGSILVGQHWDKFEVTFRVRNDELHIVQEQITSNLESYPLYRVEQASNNLSYDIRVSYNNFARGGRKPIVTCTDQIGVMAQLESSARFETGHKKAQIEIPKTVRLFQQLLSNIFFLDPVPALMRGESFSDKQLRGDGSNLTGVLNELWKEEEKRAVIIEFIKSLPEQDVKELVFSEDRRGRVWMELVESFGGQDRKWAVELLSDGTLRVLAIAAALLSAPEDSIVIIEEVDNGVHPSRAKHLLATMRKQAQKRKLRLVLSTHNPALMDALPDESLGDVIFCYRDPNVGDSRLVRLSDINDFPGLVSQGPLGHLVTAGVVDRFVKSPITADDKKRHAQQWLARLKGGGQ